MSVFDVRLVLLGCSSCGKSTLLHRLVHGRYHPGLPPTYGAEFGAKRVEVVVPGGSGTNGSEREGRSRGAGRRASSAADSGGNGSGSGRRGASVGIWDTSGAARFHSQSRRFIAGADAVLVCWEATSRDSWEAMRAWVADARAEDPAVRIYLAACKSDLVLRHNQVAHMEVQVERWPSQEQQQQQARQHSQEEKQQQCDLRQRSLQQQGAGGKPPLHGVAPSDLPERVPAAPRTPLKAERPQSPEEELEAEAEAALIAAGGGHAEAAAAAAGRQVLAEHQAAAAAELVSSLTGQSLPSPFAAVAARPLTPAEEPAASRPGSPRSTVSTRGSSLQATLSSSAPAGHAVSSEGSTAQRQAASGRRRSGPPRVRLQSAGRENAAAAAGGQQGQGSESEELPSPRPPPLQQPAVPEAAVEQYCASLGTRMFWVSACTGEGVLDAVTTIAQDVVDQRLLLWRLQQAQQAQQKSSRRSPWGSQHGASLVPQQVQQAQQAQQAQRGRSRSADSYGGQQAVGAAGSLSSRGRAARHGASASSSRGRAARHGASASSSSVRSASAGQAGREYVVGGSELGSLRQPEEPSCVIC